MSHTHRTVKHMRCTSCGREKAWPDGFGDTVSAVCWSCVWQRHLKSEHGRWWRRKVTGPAKRDARRRYLEAETARRIDEATTESAARAAARPQETP